MTSIVNKGKALVKINTDRNVNFRLKTGELYYMHLPELNTLVHVKCSGVAIRAADLKIISVIENGKRVTDSDDCTFGYQFENYDTVCFSTFARRDKCEIYHEEDVFSLNAQTDGA